MKRSLLINARKPCFTVLFVAASMVGILGAQSPKLPTLSPQDYGKFEVLSRQVSLSNDGAWLAYGISLVDGDFEVRVRSTTGVGEQTFAWGQRPEFSDDNRWVAWQIGMSESDRENLEKSGKPVRMKAGLIRLGEDSERTFDDISSFAFDATGKFLALNGYAPEEPKGRGASLRLLDLSSNTEMTFGNVGEFHWSENGSLLALAIATGRDESNGLQLFDAASGRLSSLDSSGSRYRGIGWSEEGNHLAVLKSLKPASKDGKGFNVLAWRDAGSESVRSFDLQRSNTTLGKGLEVAEHRTPSWSDDGSRIAIGLRPMEEDEPDAASEEAEGEEKEDKKDEKDKPELPGVQIWHTSDVRLYAEQKAAENRDARRTLLGVWHPDDAKLVQIGTDLLGDTELLEGWERALESLSAPYPWGSMFGRYYEDVWVVDVQSGRREKTLEKTRYGWASPGGRYLLEFDGENYWSHDLDSGAKKNLTRGIQTKFANQEYDTPTDLVPPYGVGGWLKNDQAVLLNDRFDVWQVSPDGTNPTRLTSGADEQVIHRVVDLDPEEDFLDPAQPIYLSLRGEWSEKRGYGWIPAGQSTSQRLLFDDKMFQGLKKARDANQLLYRVEARDDSPDLFAAGPDLASAKQVTKTNPFQTDYAWTHSEFVEFKSETGRRLQAGLLYPANHDPSRRYPMIVYTYELLSPQVHAYEPPSERDYYNFTAWTQNGYFVLMPDIVYTAREPGVSAIQAVRPAVAKIVDMGLVDERKVGLIGHSWGGYQATYLPTRTKIFAASVAGAPLTDFVSFMGQLHWNQGAAELSHWETGQGRMEVPYWEDPEAHERNSPIHKVHEMETPLLMAFGNDDGVVDWDQGTEFYNFARRAGKQMVLLVYEGENHGFRTKANQVDYHRRILEWFGHYLKGDPAPSWITDGVKLDDLDDEKKRVAGDSQKQ